MYVYWLTFSQWFVWGSIEVRICCADDPGVVIGDSEVHDVRKVNCGLWAFAMEAESAIDRFNQTFQHNATD